MAEDVALSQQEGVPMTLPTDDLPWGHSPQRMCAASIKEAGSKAEMVAQCPPLPGQWILLMEAQESHLQK